MKTAMLAEQMQRLSRRLTPFRWLASPVLLGLENLPATGPSLFVGNHTMFGVLDATLMLAEVFERKQIVLRGLGDRVHFKVPVWRDMLRQHGVVLGSRQNCAKLFEQRQHVLVFPGGAREVAKRKGEKYKLIWKERVGFARMAIQHGVPVVPFAAIGVEDAFDILFDAEDLLATPIGKLAAKLRLREDLVWPIVKGMGPTPIPRPERLYFGFSEPIQATAFGSDSDDDEAVFALRDCVRDKVEAAIEGLLARRENDPQRWLSARLRPGAAQEKP
jgi:1-acyl-sn-glycerol-3-phosphate acyltransferase